MPTIHGLKNACKRGNPNQVFHLKGFQIDQTSGGSGTMPPRPHRIDRIKPLY
jgi:hypothetical protein